MCVGGGGDDGGGFLGAGGLAKSLSILFSGLDLDVVFEVEGLAFFEEVVAEVFFFFTFFEIVLAEGVGGDEAVVAGVPPGGVAEVFLVVDHFDGEGFFRFHRGRCS